MFNFLLPIVLLSLLQGACVSSNEEAKNVLILSIEGLSSNMVNCIGEDKAYDSEKSLCEEFIRFSHAYTSSPLSQPALASVLTGLYPFQHNVWNNGNSYLSERFWTTSELAYDRGYRTSFFSGGGAIWRKSGLAQGFEIFDEYDIHRSIKDYRSVSELNGYFLDWLDDLSRDSSFFSMIHYTDTQFPQEKTLNEYGVEREMSRDSQWKETLESLSYLFRDLRLRNRWDNTLIILVGLNGSTPLDRESEFPAIDLHSDNTQVSLFVKPPRKPRDKGLNWTVDQNVSLVDIGATLFSFLGQEKKSQGVLRSYSLWNAIENNQVDWPEDRPILVESAWTQWQGVSNTRSALLISNKLFFHIDPLVYYNTLIDRRESIPILAKENLRKEEHSAVVSIFQKANLDVWQGINFFEIRKWKLGQILWRDGLDDHLYGELRMLAPKLPNSEQIAGWLAHHSLKEANWRRLMELGKDFGNTDWQYVAAKNLGIAIKTKNMSLCFLKLLNKEKKKKNPDRGVETPCADEDIEALLNWRTKKKEQSDYWREKFLKSYSVKVYNEVLSEKNYVAGLVWDMSTQAPSAPSEIDLYLFLPENKGIRNILSKRIPIGLFEVD